MIETTIAGRYRLEEQLATGGMGTVWRARDEVLQRPVAVKLLSETLASDEAASERFRREALMAASLTHPNMANVYDYVEDAGRPGIVMELIEGETLARALRGTRRMPIGEAVRIMGDVLLALAVAHDAGIVHRDVKPGNVLLTPGGDVKVADFGIARSLSDASLTATGTVMGTAHYSAPEQVRGEPAGPASDLYAAGVVLYEMLTGRKPFEADTAIGVAMARLGEDPEPPSRLRSAIPASLEAVVSRAMARDPADRFADARAMRDALLAAGLDADGVATETRAMVVDDDDETIAFGAPPTASAISEEPPVLRSFVPPRWAGRRAAVFIVPLLFVGLVAVLVAGSLGSAPARTAPLVRSSSPAVVACCTVPVVTGKTVGQANDLLRARGLDIGNVTYGYSSAVVGHVVKQSPTGATTLPEGGSVDLVVSKGPAPAPAPRKHGHGHGD